MPLETEYKEIVDRVDKKIEKKLADSVHARIKKFDQLIQPQLDELDDQELELAKLFLLGYLKKYVSVEEIGEISDQLGTFIERDLG